MSAVLAGAMVGSSLLSNRRGNDAEDERQRANEQAVGALRGNEKYIDNFSSIADNFAQLGQESYDKYTQMIQPLEMSLNDYYSNLNPDEYAAQGNQVAQEQYQNAMNQVNDQMVAQGMNPNDMGLSTQMGMQLGNQMAQTKAQNVMNAPHQVAQQQSEWLNYGTGRQDNAYNQLSSGVQAQQAATNMYTNNNANIANAYTGQATQANANAQFGRQDFREDIGAVGYFGSEAGWFGNDAKGNAQGADKWIGSFFS